MNFNEEMVIDGFIKGIKCLHESFRIIKEYDLSMDEVSEIIQKYGYDSKEIISDYKSSEARIYCNSNILLSYHKYADKYTLVVAVID